MYRKRHIKVAIITTVVYLILIHALFIMKFGISFYATNDWGAIYFVPIWTVIAALCGYKASEYYYTEKEKFISEENPTELMKRNWQEQRLYMVAKACRCLSLTFGMAFPVYLLAYLEESEYLKSNLPTVIVFFVISIVSLVAYRILRKRYMNYLQRGE